MVSRLVADFGWWSVTLPDRAEITLAVLILPAQADADGWTQGIRSEVESYLRRWSDAEPWLAEHPPSFAWHTEVNPSETPEDAAVVQALRGGDPGDFLNSFFTAAYVAGAFACAMASQASVRLIANRMRDTRS